MCSTFTLRAKKPRGDPWQGGNEMCVELGHAQILDVFGQPFPATKFCQELDDRSVPEARFTGLTMDVTMSGGAIVSLRFVCEF